MSKSLYIYKSLDNYFFGMWERETIIFFFLCGFSMVPYGFLCIYVIIFPVSTP